MTYTLITNQNEASQAFSAFQDGFSQGAKVFPRHTVGFPGGNKQCDVYWHRDLGIWGLFEATAVKGRFWTCFGTDNPAKHGNLNITVEINPPTSGINLRCAGAFLRDASARVYLGHSGKVGGGKKGIGKAEYRKFASDREWESVRVPGGGRLDVTVLGQVETRDLLQGIKTFVEEVAEFKRQVVGGVGSRRSNPSSNYQSTTKSASARRSGKYLPLYDHLANLKGREWRASFSEIERILGFSLPKSAYSYPAWWSNGSGMPQALMWLDAGWQTMDLNLTGNSIHFVRSTPVSAKDASMEKPSVPLPTPGEAQELDLRYQWVEIGEVAFDSRMKLTFPTVAAKPGIYRFQLELGGKRSLYIGETDNLPRRFQHYRAPGPSQATNTRLNTIFVEALQKGASIRVDVIVSTAWIKKGNVEEPADLSAKPQRVLFENAAIVQSQADDVHSLNR